MLIETDATIIERDALGRILPASSQAVRASSGAAPVEGIRREQARAYDSDKLSRWEQGLARELEEHERAQAEAAPEQSYIAMGRNAQAGRFTARTNVGVGEDAAAAPGLFAAAQSGSTVAAIPVGTTAPDGARGVNARPEAVSGARTASGERRESVTGTANVGVGKEARSAERTFVGGSAESGVATGRKAGKDDEASGEASGEDADSTVSGQELTEEERLEVNELKARDREVRTHEQAHISAGGGLVAGGASYEKQTGPDGKQYAVGGEVQIDTSEADTPEATIAKAQQVRSAALAPAQPSAQDQQVAAQAAQMETAARQEKVVERREESEDGEEGGDGEASAAKTVDGASEERESASTRMAPSRRAALAYERVSGARLPAPLSLGRGISFAV